MDVATQNEARIAKEFSLANPPDGYFDDPSIFFRMLRDYDPIHRNDDGTVLLSKHADVRAIWRDLSGTVDKTEFFRQRVGDGPLLEFHTNNLTFRDPPDHDRLRAMINPFFTQATMERLQAPVSKIVDQLLDEIADKKEVDFVKAFALRLPTDVISLMLGLPVEDGTYLHHLGDQIIHTLNPHLRPDEVSVGHKAAEEFKDYLRPHLERVRKETNLDVGRDVLSALVIAERNGQKISETELLNTCMALFIGGHGTTMNMISSSVHYLLNYPDQLKDLKENPEILDSAVEELIRFITPIQLQGRRTTKTVKIPSGELAPNTEVILCSGSANRDETVFERPDELLLRRNPNTHLAFGAGIHFCVGRPLARLELYTTLPRLFKRFQKIGRTGPAIYRPVPRFRSLTQLPLRFS